MSDEWLPRIQAGDPEAFAGWAREVEHPLRLSLRSLATRVDTEAVLQEALLRVWNVAPRFVPDGKPDALFRFAVRTARNCALTELHRRGEPAPDGALPEPAYTPEPPDPKLRAAVFRCVDALPARPRQALQLRLEAHGGLDDTALATSAGMTLNTFLQNVTRARTLVLACLERAGIHLFRDGER